MACLYHSILSRNVCIYMYVYILKIWGEILWNVNIASESWDYFYSLPYMLLCWFVFFLIVVVFVVVV